MLQNKEAECLAPTTIMPPTYDISSSDDEIESIASSSSESESASSPGLGKSKASDIINDLFGDSSSSESEKEHERPRTTDEAVMKKPLCPMSCEVPPTAAYLSVRKFTTLSSFDPETVKSKTQPRPEFGHFPGSSSFSGSLIVDLNLF